MMNLCTLALSLLMFTSYNAMAQDERYFRDMMTGELTKTEEKNREDPDIVAYSKVYELDLTSNHRFERIIFERRDGIDWVTIFNYQKELVFEYQLDTQAPGSRVYKLGLNNVSKSKRLLTLYFYEGATDYLNFQANSRLYFLTFDVNNLKGMTAQKGPAVWEEFDNKRGHYRQRSYDLNFLDLTSSGQKELIVNFRTISRAYRLDESMRWIKM